MMLRVPSGLRSRFWDGKTAGGRLDHAIGASLAVGYVAVLLCTVSGFGYTREEGFFFHAAKSYARWLEMLVSTPGVAMSQSVVDGSFGVNHETAPLVKAVAALSWRFLFGGLALFSEEGTSLRFSAMLFAGAALWLLFVWGTRAHSRAAGFMAALLFATLPRVFGHAHLNAVDVPVATMGALTAYAYWRSRQAKGVLFPLATGVLFGLALDTGHAALSLPFVLGAHAVLAWVSDRFSKRELAPRRPPWALLSMALVGPLVCLCLWPWMWADTALRLWAYVASYLRQGYLGAVFLGVSYPKPPMPWAFAWIMTAATVPAITLVLFAVGCALRIGARVAVWRGRSTDAGDPWHTGLLWALGVVGGYLPWLSSRVSIVGGARRFLPAYPFLCLLAAVGAATALEKIGELVGRWQATRGASSSPDAEANGSLRARVVFVQIAAAALLLAAPLGETVGAYPWNLLSYTPLVGGAPGAASLGLGRNAWGSTTGAVADYLNRNTHFGDRVYQHETGWDAWELLQNDGRLRSQVRGVTAPHNATLALYHDESELEGVEYQIWEAFGTTSPVHVEDQDGVPVIHVYKKRGPAQDD